MSTWVQTNHGGKPTKNKDVKRAIFIGRFQPYHYGHIGLVEQKLKQGVPCLLLVRDIEPDDANPFTADETIDMINYYHQEELLNVDGEAVPEVICMKIPDIESVNYGRGVGYEVNEWTPSEATASISATKIRTEAKAGRVKWKTMVPYSLHNRILKKLGEKG